MGDIFNLLLDAGFAGFVIIGLGLFALVVIVERVKYLFKETSLDSESFLKQIRTLIREDKIEDGVNFCSANEASPVAYVTRAILEKSDRDSRAIEEAQEVAVSDIIPNLTKGLGYLTMVANVATLVGLLGTIQGLIMSFKAVGHAEPGQKQALLADGISMAMNTTALGLSVAIPVMIVYAFLHSRQGKIFEQITRVSGRVIEELKARDFAPFGEETVFSNDIGSDSKLVEKMPEKPKKKKTPAA